jgi:hypothetical protein
VSLFSQVYSYTVTSSKEYPNNTRTSYIELDIKIDVSSKDFISQEILSNPLISNFSFYDKSDLSKCMFTYETSIDDITIVQMIYDFTDANNGGNDSRFSESWESENENEYFFQIDGINSDIQSKQIVEYLMKDQNIKNAVINSSGCKIITLQELTPEYIQKILDKFEVNISPESID